MAKQFRPRGRIKVTLTSGSDSWTFTESDLVRLDAKTAVDPLSRRLPTESLTFSVLDFDGNYDPSNPDGKWAAIDQNAKIEVEYGIMNGSAVIWLSEKDKYILDGRPSWQRGVATFLASSSLLHLTQTYYKASDTPGTLYDIALDMIYEAGAPDYSIWYGLSNYAADIPLPVDSIRNNLQRIAQAAGCTLCTKHGVITIAPYEEDDIVDGAYSMTLKDIVQDEDVVQKTNKVYTVKGYQYERKNADAETIVYQQAVYTIGNGETIHIEYDAVQDPVLTVSSGTVVSANLYARGADIVMDYPGVYEITITGKRIGQTGTLVQAVVSTDTEGSTLIINNPLINSITQLNGAIYKAANYLHHRITHTLQTRGNPEQEPLDGLNFVTEYGVSAHGLILSNEVIFDGILHGKLDVLSLNEGEDNEAATLQDIDEYFVQDSNGDQILVVGNAPYISAHTADEMDDMAEAVLGY